jgi:transcriptional regulator with XRE-family HTH domain
MRFAEIRKIMGYTQRQIAQIVGVSQQFWNDLEKGRKRMKKTTQSVFVQRLGINPDWLAGKNVSLFSDREKGLAFIKDKSVLSRWEILFLLEVIQHVWSWPDLQEIETRNEYFLSLCRILLSVTDRYKPHKDLVKDFVQYLTKSKTSVSIPVSQADLISQSVISNLKRDDLVFSPEDEKMASNVLLPWSYYVAQSYFTIKAGLVPVSSVFFSDLKNVLNSSEVDKNFIFTCTKKSVQFEYKDKKFFIRFKKGHILCDLHKAFSFFVTLMRTEKGVTRKVLDYEIFVDNKTGNVHIAHHDMTLIISPQEYSNLIIILDQFISDNLSVWLSLQKACLEKYGFV